ncbi:MULTISPECIES: two pore domain potassium channel family protein [unclassified Cupriavidus]|uniref:two pore domain potassium channel family protein n=1 Tax=Cupriavidus sp. H19C3 TaxID=3241603 RepID=UPI003BF82AC2
MPETAAHYLIAILLTTTLTVITVALHYEALRLISNVHPRHWSGKVNIGAMLVLIIIAHCVEALVFALGYWFGTSVLQIGTLKGMPDHGIAAFVYFSLETFTTQSIGDIFPVGPLRLVAAVQPLVGLMLIGWSTSFTFLLMRRDWRADELDERD